MTKDEAIRLANSGWWKDKTPQEIAEFQLVEEKLCMPFSDFHKAVEAWLERPVWTHELANTDELMAEGHGENKKRSMNDVIQRAQDLMGDKPVVIIKADS